MKHSWIEAFVCVSAWTLSLACSTRPAKTMGASALVANSELPKAQKEERVTFSSHSTSLVGTLVWPASRAVAAVAFVHGSGRQERNFHWARSFAADGIAALVYDKRGVGESGGDFEEQQSVGGPNISLLADDAVAAVAALSVRLPNDVSIGLAGISQAGWIVPLAAERSPLVRFTVLWSGPVCKVSEEDIFSKYTADKDSNVVPTYEEALTSREEPYVWPDFLGIDTDPSDSLRKLSIPGLWIFGGRDGSVPVDLSIKRLRELQNQGYSYDYELFPNLGHNNMDETFGTATAWIGRQQQTASERRDPVVDGQ